MRLRKTPRLEKVSIGDRRWFSRHPDRSYRIRPTAEAELEMFVAGGIPFPEVRPGARWWTGVRQLRPSHRLKVYFESDRAVDLDDSEAEARVWYERTVASSVEVQRIESGLAKAIGGSQ